MPHGTVKAPRIRTCHSFSEPAGFKIPTHIRPITLVHDSTDCKQQILRDSAFFLGMFDVKRHHGTKELAISRILRERITGDDGL